MQGCKELLGELWKTGGNLSKESHSGAFLQKYVKKCTPIFKAGQKYKLPIEKLQNFQQMLNESQDEACWRMGGNVLLGMGVEGINHFEVAKGKDAQKIKSNVAIQSGLIMKENDLINRASDVKPVDMDNGKFVPAEKLPLVVAAKLIQDNHGNRNKNTTYYLGRMDRDAFTKEIFEVVQNRIPHEPNDQNMVDYDRVVDAINENKAAFAKDVEAFCKQKIQTLKAEAEERKAAEAEKTQNISKQMEEPKKEAAGLVK